MIIENLQEIIRGVLKDFDIYDEQDEDLVNILSERIFSEITID